jgi:hypothetical protein
MQRNMLQKYEAEKQNLKNKIKKVAATERRCIENDT